MQPFLKTIARQYAARYSDLSRFCFIFPGRRSGTFFIKHLREAIGRRTMIAPQTVTITDFTRSLSPFVCDNRIDLLFLLYRCYLELVGITDDAEVPEQYSFEAFRSWGEVILADFNEVDTHMVNPDELFKNLRDFNEISANYLTDDQREVMETYFNIRQPHAEAEKFWRTFAYTSPREGETTSHTELKDRFIYLWQMLAPLHKLFNSRLESEGLTYDGRAALHALDHLRRHGSRGIEPLKVVFVGFNVLTTVEWRIFREMQKLTTVIEGREEPLADFVWDLTGIVMDDDFNSAARFVRKGIQQFPKPDWLALDDSDTDGLPPELKVISAPSNAIQAKIVGREVAGLHARLTQKEFDEARIAVVLPDEGLLLPMIHSLPDTMVEEEDEGTRRSHRSIGVNLTMGLPLRLTPVVSFVALLRRLQTRLRNDSGRVVFFYEDVEAVLAHPFAHILLGSKQVMAISGEMQQRRLRYVSETTLAKLGGTEAAALFRALPGDCGAEGVISYLDNLLEEVDRRHSTSEPATVSAEEGGEGEAEEEAPRKVTMDTLTHTHIDTYRRALARLLDACRHRNIRMKMFTVFMLADRLLASEKVMFEGEPLQGLQIMGLLETRSLDFDHIIIPSMNERIFPRRMRTRTFIPDSLRTAFGLPTSWSQESIYAYYFYRLICRAKSVTMVYDARTGGSRSGDPSRFILQLRHLYAREGLNCINSRFALPVSPVTPLVIPKDEGIMSRLRAYTTGGRTLSASSLQKYLQCPVQFYFSYLAGVNVEDKPTEFMSAIDLGNIVHEAMMLMYLDADRCKCRLRIPQPVRSRPDSERISTLVREAINTQYLHRDPRMPLTGEPSIQAEIIESKVNGLVDLDMAYDALEIVGVEIPDGPDPLKIRLSNGTDVYFTMHIDRVDRVTHGDGRSQYRIVDYKTGGVSLISPDAEGIFVCDKDTKYFFQLMLYASLSHRSRKLSDIDSFGLVIYHMNGRSEVRPRIGKGKGATVIENDRQGYYDAEGVWHESLLDDFERVLDQRLTEMFDPQVPLRQTDDVKTCAYCNFRDICRR